MSSVPCTNFLLIFFPSLGISANCDPIVLFLLLLFADSSAAILNLFSSLINSSATFCLDLSLSLPSCFWIFLNFFLLSLLSSTSFLNFLSSLLLTLNLSRISSPLFASLLIFLSGVTFLVSAIAFSTTPVVEASFPVSSPESPLPLPANAKSPNPRRPPPIIRPLRFLSSESGIFISSISFVLSFMNFKKVL